MFCLMTAIQQRLPEFTDRINQIVYSKETYYAAKNADTPKDVLEAAIIAYIRRRMSRGGAVTTYCWSSRFYNGLPEEISGFERAKKELPAISERLQGVTLTNLDALDVIRKFDSPTTLHYLDPPYLPETRISKNVYNMEMTISQHEQLADVCRNLSGKIILSGYPSSLYTKLYAGWRCMLKETPNHSSMSKAKEMKTECLWCNFG
jgi:DNA adenine methylase